MAKKTRSLMGVPDGKEAMTRGLQFFIRTATTVSTAIGSVKIGDKIPPKFQGPGLLLLGLAGEMLIEEPHFRAVAQGVGAFGALHTGATFLPDGKKMLGLAGTEEPGVSGQDEQIGEAAYDWNKIADEAERIASKKTLSGEDPLQGESTETVAGTEEPISGTSTVSTLLN